MVFTINILQRKSPRDFILGFLCGGHIGLLFSMSALVCLFQRL